MNLVMGPIGGAIIDKQGKSKNVALVASTAVLIFTIVVILLPKEPSLFKALLVVAVLITGFAYLNSTTVYTPFSEAKIPVSYVGTAIGIASAMGYSTDAWLFNVCGHMLDKYGDIAGYTFIFTMEAFGAVVMIVCTLLLAREYKKINAEKAEPQK
ncbi:hypothetical protein D1155_14395 [Anaerotruncus sp. 80]|uniref:Major facilitator superfamily (MFS) profile domain-containing protein n=2 Tax=Oscillospiraceae TaxID=216572 RepID=A0A845QNM9_9FIRM|nr:hypothetical protein [Anaerotruncus colihominis]NCF03489.1 hypothetical protein [Anaerotruncus sp. 80]